MVELFRLVNHFLSSLYGCGSRFQDQGEHGEAQGEPSQMDSDMPLVDVIRVCTKKDSSKMLKKNMNLLFFGMSHTNFPEVISLSPLAPRIFALVPLCSKRIIDSVESICNLPSGKLT
jgi:hypothetical protein